MESLGIWAPGGHPRPQRGQNIQHRAQRNIGEGQSVPHRCSLKVLPGRQAQITEAVQLRSRITGKQVGLLSPTASAGSSLPSYKKALGFILCNFFFLEGKQHELPKAADGSKFWVVKCQADGSKQLGIYGACRRGVENVPSRHVMGHMSSAVT